MTDLELQDRNTECSSAYWRERVGRETSAASDITHHPESDLTHGS